MNAEQSDLPCKPQCGNRFAANQERKKLIEKVHRRNETISLATLTAARTIHEIS